MKYRRNWQDVTYPRSATSQMNGHLKLAVKEIPTKEQLYRLEKNMKKLNREIIRLEEVIRTRPKDVDIVSRATTSLMHKTKLSHVLIKRQQSLQNKVEAEFKRQETLREEERKAEETRKANAAKIRAGKPLVAPNDPYRATKEDLTDMRYRSAHGGESKRYKVFDLK